MKTEKINKNWEKVITQRHLVWTQLQNQLKFSKGSYTKTTILQYHFIFSPHIHKHVHTICSL